MFENKEFSYGRSGTAPTRQSAKAPVQSRVRPKTRVGVSNDGGASDLADLNLALKMDNQLNVVDNDDAFENYQSAIDSWETGLLSRHAPRSSRPSSKSGSKSSSTYKSSDPVSAAYFSQFRPSSRSTSSPTNSPRSRLKNASSTRAQEVKAVYGLSSSTSNSSREAQSGGSAGPGRRKPRPSDVATRIACGGSSSTRSSNVSSSSRPPSAAASLGRERGSRPGSGAARKSPAQCLESDAALFPRQQQPPPQSSFQKNPSINTSMKGSSFKRQHMIVSSPSIESNIPDFIADSEDSSPPTKKVDSVKSDRPESRKLYLGGAGGGGADTDAVLGTNTTAQKQDQSHKVPRSAGSKKMADNSSSAAELLLQCDEEDDLKINRTASISGLRSPAPWGDNLDDRPPSRQRSAFPTHLGEAMDLKRRATNGTGPRSTNAFSTESPPTNEIQQQQQQGTQNQAPVPSLSRPPSRQRLNAQHLWSGKPDGDEESPSSVYSSDENSCNDSESQGFNVSPVLTAHQSAASYDLQDEISIDKNLMSLSSRSPSPQIALGPMYDPFADGFSQLENRGNTAPPFKIRYNPSAASASTVRKKPGTANPKSAMNMRGISSGSGKDVEFNDCEVVEDYSDQQFNSQGLTRGGNGKGKGLSSPNISTSCQSSPSPEQMETYSAWRSNNSSPSSQLSRSKSATGRDKDDTRQWSLGKSSSQASVFARSFSPSNQRQGVGAGEGGRIRAFINSGDSGEGSMSQHSPTTSPVSSRHRNHRTLASNLDDMSFADEELTVMTNCSEADLDNGNDVNMFGEQLSQSIMLESSLGQDFLNLFAPSD